MPTGPCLWMGQHNAPGATSRLGWYAYYATYLPSPLPVIPSVETGFYTIVLPLLFDLRDRLTIAVKPVEYYWGSVRYIARLLLPPLSPPDTSRITIEMVTRP